MGVKTSSPQLQLFNLQVSIPFSSGHGGKAKIGYRIVVGEIVSIPFSSGHGGKDEPLDGFTVF